MPHFIEHYDARQDIWTRSLPLLVVLYVLRGLYALDLDEGVGFNILALLLVVAVLLATWSVTNLLRRRPAFARPPEVGPWELSVFVVGPEIPVLMFGQWTDVAKAMVAGLATLLVVYLATSYALVPILRWAGTRAVAMVDSLGSVLRRAPAPAARHHHLPVLPTEVWEVMGALDGMAYWLTLGLFFVVGLARRLPPAGRRGERPGSTWPLGRGPGPRCRDAGGGCLPDEGAPPRRPLPDAST